MLLWYFIWLDNLNQSYELNVEDIDSRMCLCSFVAQFAGILPYKT